MSVGCHDVLVVVESARKVRGSVLKLDQVRLVHDIQSRTYDARRDDDATIGREPTTASLIHEYSHRSILAWSSENTGYKVCVHVIGYLVNFRYALKFSIFNG